MQEPSNRYILLIQSEHFFMPNIHDLFPVVLLKSARELRKPFLLLL